MTAHSATPEETGQGAPGASSADPSRPAYTVRLATDDFRQRAAARDFAERWSRVRSLHVQPVLEIRDELDAVCLVGEPEAGCALTDLAPAARAFTPAQVLCAAQQLLLGLAALHDQELSHGALSATTVFVDENGSVCIGGMRQAWEANRREDSSPASLKRHDRPKLRIERDLVALGFLLIDLLPADDSGRSGDSGRPHRDPAASMPAGTPPPLREWLLRLTGSAAQERFASAREAMIALESLAPEFPESPTEASGAIAAAPPETDGAFPMRSGLFRQTFLAMAAMGVVLVTVMGFVFFMHAVEHLETSAREGIGAFATSTAALVNPDDLNASRLGETERRLKALLETTQRLHPTVAGIHVYRIDAESSTPQPVLNVSTDKSRQDILADLAAAPLSIRESLKRGLREPVSTAGVNAQGGQKAFAAFAPVPGDGGEPATAVVGVSLSFGLVDELRHQIIVRVIFLVAAVMAVAFGLSWLMTRFLQAPIAALCQSVNRAAKGDLDTSPAIRTGNELETLAEAIRAWIADLREKDVLRTAMDRNLSRRAFERLFPDSSARSGQVMRRRVAVLHCRIDGLGQTGGKDDRTRAAAWLNRLAACFDETVNGAGGKVLRPGPQHLVAVFSGSGRVETTERAVRSALALRRAYLAIKNEPDAPSLTLAMGLEASTLLASREDRSARLDEWHSAMCAAARRLADACAASEETLLVNEEVIRPVRLLFRHRPVTGATGKGCASYGIDGNAVLVNDERAADATPA